MTQKRWFLPFPTKEHLEESDDKLGQRLLSWWSMRIAFDRGLNPYNLSIEEAANIIEETRQFDSSDVLHAMLEKAIKRAAWGEFAIAGQMVRVLFFDGHANLVAHDEATTGKRRQKRNASKPRRDELQCLIIEILTEKPDITPTALLIELKKYKDMRKVIADITEDEIYFTGKDENSSKSATISGLKDRLTRAKKYINSL